MGYPPGMMGYLGGAQGSSYGAQGGVQGQASQGYSMGEPGGRVEAPSEAQSLSQVLAASGVPNDGSRLRWPVGLSVVGGPEADDLRRQIEAGFQQEAEQTQTGPVNPHLARELSRAVDGLRKLLRQDRDERFSLALTTYEDAERFLARLDHAQKVLEAGLEPPGGKAELTARPANAADVGLHDDRFDPLVLTVPAGATVRWTNHGRHVHTVTAADGRWDSGDLGPGASYSYTFNQPGTYGYYCRHHAQEGMRGTVLVR